MVDNKTEELINAVRTKEKFTVRFIKSCNENGEISVQLVPAFKPRKPEATYVISLITFTTTNLIANIHVGNNKFYYHNTKKLQDITIPTGFYSIEKYGEAVKKLIKQNGDDPEAVTISIDYSTGLISILISKGYKVLFNKENTWRDSLGFSNIDLTGDKEHIGTRLADTWPTQEVFVHCSACKGNRFISANGNCEESDQIFSFPANQKYGAPITYQIDPKLTESELDLATGQLDKIRFRFTDDQGKSVTFGGSKVSMSLRITQV